MNGNHTLSFVPDDGYTEKGFIKSIPGLHGDLRFEYRPFLVEERSKLLSGFDKLEQEKQDVIVARTFSERITAWDLQGKDGEEIPICLHIARRLKPALFYRLWAIILGTDASDLDPEWSSEEKTDLLESEIEANEGPAPIDVKREIAAEKNSALG